MFSVIFAAMGCAVGLALAGVSLRMVIVAHRAWETRWSSAPAVARWLWAATVVCCAITSVMMVVMSAAVIALRGPEAGMEGSLAARVAVYVGALGYLIAWLRGKINVRWPSTGRRSPKLLPPAPEGIADADVPRPHSDSANPDSPPNPLGSTEH